MAQLRVHQCRIGVKNDDLLIQDPGMKPLVRHPITGIQMSHRVKPPRFDRVGDRVRPAPEQRGTRTVVRDQRSERPGCGNCDRAGSSDSVLVRASSGSSASRQQLGTGSGDNKVSCHCTRLRRPCVVDKGGPRLDVLASLRRLRRLFVCPFTTEGSCPDRR